MPIRAVALPSDLPALQALWRATWRDAYGPMLGPGRLHLIDEALTDTAARGMIPPDGGAIVASVEGSLIGSACFAGRHGIGYLWGMYVHPAHQHRGWGSALVWRAAACMPEAAVLQVMTVRPAATAFYRRLGFDEAGVDEVEAFAGVTWAAEVLRATRTALTPPA